MLQKTIHHYCCMGLMGVTVSRNNVTAVTLLHFLFTHIYSTRPTAHRSELFFFKYYLHHVIFVVYLLSVISQEIKILW